MVRAKRKRAKNLAIILFSAAALAVLVITVYTSIIINSFSSVIKENIEERLLAIVRSVSIAAYPYNLDSLTAPEDMKSFEYYTLRQHLIRFGKDNNIQFVYFMRPLPDGTVQFIADNNLEKPRDLTTTPVSMYEGARQAINKRTAVSSLSYSGKPADGLLSAYAPVMNDRDEVIAVAGIDISDKQLVATQKRFEVISIILIAAMLLTLASGLSNFFVFKKNADVFSKRLKQQELMSSLSASFISDKKTGDLITNTIRITGEFLGVHQIIVSIFGNDSFIHEPAYSWRKDGAIPSMPELTGFNDLLKKSFPPVYPGIDTVILFCNDVESNKAYQCMKSSGVTAFMWAPIYINGKFWAVLSIEYCTGTRFWSESDRQLIRAVISVIAGSVTRNVREKERDTALSKAEKASQAKSNFLANMSHEMRTPMNAIIGMTAIAKKSDDMEKMNYCLQKIEEASSHLLGVINDILDMSKIEANKFELSSIEFNFERILKKVVNVFIFRIDEKNQNFSVHIDSDIPPILVGDDLRLSQVIANLISNAIKFTPEGGVIRLDTKLTEDFGNKCIIRFNVSDSGIGISKEHKMRLFTSFEQADSSTSRKFGGTGLGLAISKRIVEMMGGRIWVESEPTKGSTFTFTAMFTKGTKHQTTYSNLKINWNNIKILVINDDKLTLEYFSELTDWFSINCTTAGGADEALELIEKNGPYDIYFIDWKMTSMDGLELTKQIKAKTKQKDNQVVMIISGNDWTAIKDDATKAGVDNFVSKPLFPSTIADCINQSINKKGKTELEEKAAEKTYDFSGSRIILAEDIEINREIVLSLLEPTGLAIDCAVNGKEAVELYRAGPDKYNMIFMDLQMPEMDGFEATHLIRNFESSLTPLASKFALGIPIIAMTANVFREDVEKCLAAGMNSHVGKPLDIEEIFLCLDKYL